MRVIRYNKIDDGGKKLATFSVSISNLNMTIANLAIIQSANGGYFINMPTYKEKSTDNWEKVVVFDGETQKNFIRAAREAIDIYAKQENIIIG